MGAWALTSDALRDIKTGVEDRPFVARNSGDLPPELVWTEAGARLVEVNSERLQLSTNAPQRFNGELKAATLT